MDEFAAWCRRIGAKLLDTDIDPDDVLKGTLDAKTITKRPGKMPIAIDWPEEMYKIPEVTWSVVVDGQEHAISDLEISIINPALNGALKLAIASESTHIEVELKLFEETGVPNYRFITLNNQTAQVRRHTTETSLTDFFYANPPMIWFADGSALDGNQYVEMKKNVPPYDAAKIEAWDWTGVDIRKESQGTAKDPSSIQSRVIRELKSRDYVMIFDDDGNGEAADVVAIRLAGDQAAPTSIDVEFYHCKYSQEAMPGKRITDLYEVCGQAQKSVSWMSTPEKRTDLFTHLLRREAARNDRGDASRIEFGDGELLQTIRDMSYLCPVRLKIFIVQPGVSKQDVSPPQLRLMGVTENYMFETYQLPFGVIASA